MANQEYHATVTPAGETRQSFFSSFSNTTGRDIATLVLGVLSLYFSITGTIPVVSYLVALILGIIGAVLGVRGRKDTRLNSKGVATAGLVCSVIGITLGAIMFLLTGLLAGAVGALIGQVAPAASEIIQDVSSMLQ